ncbi:MAG: primosomal protein N' [Clostridiales bacterium]|nr:primosomal protein N' [Clostridiales bacterium]
MFCQVIIDIVHENVASPFTYRIPDGMHLEPGQRVAVPFGRREKEGIVLDLSDSCDIEESRIRDVLKPLEEYPAVPPELMDLARQMAEDVHCPLAETLRLMLPAQMRGGRVRVKTERTAKLAVSPEEAFASADREKRSRKRADLLRILSDGEVHTVKELAEQVRDPNEALKKLSGDGLVILSDEETLRTPGTNFAQPSDPGFTLTPGQEEALEEILPCLRGKGGRFLLHGVTGSGKTEVFMAAVRNVLTLGKSAIILVPEIALTPQMVAWFRGRFGPVAAVIHSRLSPGERFDEWRRIRRGDARVVIGARSAVFSPARNLGLIVVDEEHEGTYLSDHHPRYDAREIANSRCERENATLILASATPSVLSFARARRGDYMLLEMPRRVQNRPLPEVEIVDMREELENGNRTVLSMALRKALKETAAQGGQAMLLMNRRGYNSFVSCRSCGYVVKCPNCDISMTYHMASEDGLLRCHYCGHAMKPPAACPECGGKYIRYFGAGTQKVEEEVAKLLPGVPAIRMDYDTTSGKDGHGKILEEFRSGRARILIGTQMIAKGLDFPRVTLVGVVAADMTLNLPDYRSRERTFQLLTQVAGRAGRGEQPGKVIIQTYKPEDPVIGFAAAQDYRSFFEDEFTRRRRGLYPPFTLLARFLTESVSEEAAAAAADRLEQETRRLVDSHPAWGRKLLLISNDTPGVKVLRGKNRRHVLMKMLVGREAEEMIAAMTELARGGFENTEVWFEVNPTTMM